ncbi:universal stress protein [Flexivirga caeni]|uniref:universal stress protein n=1 Tax=Flexivirga caeni TaxID=2294115 RepID=UPI0013154FC3|nr:universal stress protein [Flexivirga caeni]
MTTIVAYRSGSGGREALRLGALWARSASSKLLVVSAFAADDEGVPTIDIHYRDILREQLSEAMADAKSRAPEGVDVEFRIQDGHSIPSALTQLGEQESADLIVVGNSAHGMLGRVSLGSVANHLVHSSPVPIALAPRGFRTSRNDRVTRVVAAFGGQASKSGLVLAAAGICAQTGAELQLAAFVVQPRSATPESMQALTRDIHDKAQEVLTVVKALPNAPKVADTIVRTGESWTDAVEGLEWETGDVLVVGSSDMSTGRRVFLGSNGMRIVRASPVPVIVVPRAAVDTLAERAAEG